MATGPVILGGATPRDLYRLMTDAEVHEPVDAARAAGVRHFDTSPQCGLGLDYRQAPAELPSRARRIAGACARHDVELPHVALWDDLGVEGLPDEHAA